MPRLDEPTGRTVWVVEEGDDERRGIELVADSAEAAIAAIIALFPPTTKVGWDSPTSPPPREGVRPVWHLAGHFDYVPDKSVEQTLVFDITEYPLETLTQRESAGHQERLAGGDG